MPIQNIINLLIISVIVMVIAMLVLIIILYLYIKAHKEKAALNKENEELKQFKELYAGKILSDYEKDEQEHRKTSEVKKGGN